MLADVTRVLQALPPSVAPTAPEPEPASIVPEVAWSSLTPVLILFGGAVVGLVIASLLRRALPRSVAALWTVGVAVAALVSVFPLWGRVGNPAEGPASLVSGALAFDRFSLFATALLCVAVVFAALLADGYLRREDLEGPELYALLLLAAVGGAVMVSANDLIVTFIGLEVLSISTYVLTAMHRRRVSSQEAGLKYFVLGAFSSAFLLYGIALVYGATGGTNLLHVQTFLSENLLDDDYLLLAGLAMLLVGFGFKVAAAPLHMWTPDVYQGAPTPVTAFMASAVKTAAFAAMLRVFVVGFASQSEQWRPVVLTLCVLSLVVGSVAAVVQTNVKRMLAYSSISHAGFLLLGIEAASERGTSSVLVYLAAYTVMVAGSFGVVTLVGRTGDGRHGLDDYRGLARAHPGLALAFAVFLLAQAGTPFTVGFIAKLGVITAVAERGDWWIAAVAMLSAVVSAFLYLRIIVAMYFDGADDHGAPVEGEVPVVSVPWGARVAIGLAVVATLGLGVAPGLVSGPASDAVPEPVAVAEPGT